MASELQKKQVNQETANNNAEFLDNDLKGIDIKPEVILSLPMTETAVIDWLIKASGNKSGFDDDVKKKIQQDLKDGDKNPNSFYNSKNKKNKKNKVPYGKIRENAWPNQGSGAQEPQPQNEAGETPEPEKETPENLDHTPKNDNPNNSEEEKKRALEEARKEEEKRRKDELRKKTEKEVKPKVKPPGGKSGNDALKKIGQAVANGAKQLWAGLAKLAAPLLPYLGIIVIVILVILAIIAIIFFVAPYILHGGKFDHNSANAASNYGQIQANLAASKIETLKKALDENVDDFIKQIQNIKDSSKKDDIKTKCDEIIKDANALKALPAADAPEIPALLPGGPTTPGTKETLKAKIMDKVTALIKLITSDSSALAQQLIDRINNGKATCFGESNFSTAACKDLKDQAELGHAYNSHGQQIILNPTMLSTLLALIDQYNLKIEISTLASSHPGNWPNSRHHSGNAVDIFAINGTNLVNFYGNKSADLNQRIDLKTVDILKQIANASQIIYSNDPRRKTDSDPLPNGGHYDDDISVYGTSKPKDSGHTNHIHLGY